MDHETNADVPPADPLIQVGVSCVPLIAEPARWINRRVETIELLASEETRRRVSVDFTLSPEQQRSLTLPDGVVVPISVLTKEARRNFDLRDEGGRALPALGRAQNGELAHIAVLSAVLDALVDDPSRDAFQMIAADLRQIVFSPPSVAQDALAFFIGSAENGDAVRAPIWADPVCRQLLQTLWQHYVLFAVLVPEGPTRRVVKYSYGEDFDFSLTSERLRDRFAPTVVRQRVSRPDRARFFVQCPGAWRAASFHVEIATPEELKFECAALVDLSDEHEDLLSDVAEYVDRASLYSHRPIRPESDVQAYVEITPERHGQTFQAAMIGTVVTALLWLGVISGLDAKNPGAAVSLLLAGAALFSGFAARQGIHKLVRTLFSSARRWLAVVALAALTASATLAMEYPRSSPVDCWRWAAIACSIASARLIWTALRAPK